MYRRPKFLEVLLDIRQEMARLADYDVDLFAEMVRSGKGIRGGEEYSLLDPDAQSRRSAKTGTSKSGAKKTAGKS